MNSIQKNIDRFPKRKGRKIVFNGITWKYTVSEAGGVIAYSDKGERLYNYAHIVRNSSVNDFERGQWKRTQGGSVTPKDIVNWIKNRT